MRLISVTSKKTGGKVRLNADQIVLFETDPGTMTTMVLMTNTATVPVRETPEELAALIDPFVRSVSA